MPLNQDWERWPYATVVEMTLPLATVTAARKVIDQTNIACWVIRRERNAGVPYEIETAAGAWRSAGELVAPGVSQAKVIPVEHIRAADLTAFVRHFGPPEGLTDPQTVSRFAAQTMVAFRDLSQAWTDGTEDPDGVSHIRLRSVVKHPARAAENWLRWWLLNAPARWVNTLLYIWVECALQQLGQGGDMVRCLACGNWVAMTTGHKRFCSTACRVAYHSGTGQRGRRQLLEEG